MSRQRHDIGVQKRLVEPKHPRLDRKQRRAVRAERIAARDAEAERRFWTT